jgi:hypothetical protein
MRKMYVESTNGLIGKKDDAKFISFRKSASVSSKVASQERI